MDTNVIYPVANQRWNVQIRWPKSNYRPYTLTRTFAPIGHLLHIYIGTTIIKWKHSSTMNAFENMCRTFKSMMGHDLTLIIIAIAITIIIESTFRHLNVSFKTDFPIVSPTLNVKNRHLEFHKWTMFYDQCLSISTTITTTSRANDNDQRFEARAANKLALLHVDSIFGIHLPQAS